MVLCHIQSKNFFLSYECIIHGVPSIMQIVFIASCRIRTSFCHQLRPKGPDFFSALRSSKPEVAAVSGDTTTPESFDTPILMLPTPALSWRHSASYRTAQQLLWRTGHPE